MKNIIEILEDNAKEFMVVNHYFTSKDSLMIFFYPDAVEGTEFDYFHNGISITRERAMDLVPGFAEDLV